MIYIKTDINNMVVSEHYKPFDSIHGLGKSEEELLKTGYLVDSIPIYEDIPGKMRVITYTQADGFSCMYKDIAVQPDEKDIKIEQLELATAELGLTIEQDKIETQLAIAELASLLTGGNE